MQKLGAIILVILVLSMGLAPSEVVAQSGCNFNYLWATTQGTPVGISFRQTPRNAYTPLNPLTRADYANVLPTTGGAGWIIIAQIFQSTVPCTPTQVVVTWRRGSGNTGGLWLETSTDGNTWTVQNHIVLGFTHILTPQIYTWANTGNISFTHIRFRMLTIFPELHQFRMDTPEPDPEFLYPLLARDEWTDNSDLSAYERSNEHEVADYHSVIGYSNTPGAYVHAIADGTITKVQRITSGKGSDCQLSVINCDFTSNKGWNPGIVISLTDSYWWGDDKNIWLVELLTEWGTVRYVVADALMYSRQDTTVKAGCIIGRTLRSRWYSLDTTGVNKNPLNEGVFIIHLVDGGNSTPLLPYFTTHPVQGSACNADDATRNCLGDFDLSSQSDWSTQGQVTFKDPFGVIIGRFSNVQSTRPFNLNPDRAPSVTVNARNSFGQGTLRVKIGQTESSWGLSNSYQQFTIAGGSHSPDTGGYFNIAVFNDGDGAIDIEYVCVSHTLQADEITPEIPPPPHKDGCYFTNPYMDDEAQGWNIYAGDVTRLTGGMGVEAGGGFGQGGIILFPDGATPQTYTLTIRANLWAFSSYSPTETDATDISITYSLAGTPHTALDTHTVGAFVSSEFGVMTYQNTFNVSANVNGTIIFRVTISTPQPGLRGLVIRDACLEAGDTTNGGTSEEFPGFDDEGESGTPGDRPFPEYCSQVESGNNGFAWLWGHLNSFFQCQLMVILNDIYEAIMDFFRMVGWFIRWMMTVIQMIINWMGYQVLPWLAGYMVNIMGSQPNAVLYTSNPGQEVYESCNWYDIFCHARNLFDTVGGVINGVGNFLGGLIQGVINVIGGLLQGIVDVIEWLWEQLVNLFNGIINIIRGLFEGLFQILQWIWQAITSVIQFIINIATVIINALISLVSTIISWIVTIVQVIGAIITGASSATPITVPGLPSCGTPTSHPLCLIYWALENTILSGLGAVFIPLLTAIFAIRFAIWYIAKWRATLIEVVTTS